MGFGLLFFGYFMTTMMSVPLSGLLQNIDLAGIVKLLGYVLIIIAAKKLSEYNSGFKTLVASSALMICVSAFEAIVGITVFLANNQIAVFPFSNAFSYISENYIVDLVTAVPIIVFVATLCVAVKQIATDTGVKKIEIAATRNFVFYCILFALQALLLLPIEWNDTAIVVLNAAVRIIELLCWILVLYMLFSCYAKICDSSDVEMKQKPSRFDFVNKKREEEAAERQRILDEYDENAHKIKKKRKK